MNSIKMLGFASTGMKKESSTEHGNGKVTRKGPHRPVITSLKTNEPKGLLGSKKKSHSTGSSGFSISSLLPNVSKKFGMLGQKFSSPSYTSSTGNIGGSGSDPKSKPRLVRSQSVRTGRGSLVDPTTTPKPKLKRHRSVGSVDGMAEHFAVCSSLVEISNKMVVPGSLHGIMQDVNNNVTDQEDPPLAQGTVKRKKKKNRERKLSVKIEGAGEIQDIKDAKDGQDRERVAELKEAQDRVTRRRTPSSSSKSSHQERSRSRDRSRRKSTDSNAKSTSSADVVRDFGDVRAAAAEATDSGVGTDAAERYQHGNICDTVPGFDQDYCDGDAEMIARATKALHEHVKDVRACCIGKPPVKKESYNNQYNSQYHGSTKDHENHHHHHHQGNYPPPYDNPRSPRAFSPPPYSNGHSPKAAYHHGSQHPAAYKGSQYPASDTRTAPPPVQSPLIIPNNNIGHIAVPEGGPKHHDHHYIVNENTGTTYVKGKLLGKGGFAKCYELTDVKTNKTYAGKIISKSRLTKPHQKEKILREIELHKSLKHRHVVAFHSYFEDSDNVYIVLELCCMKSLVHVLKCRKTLTEPEVRFFMRHLVDGCRFIHNERVIHRDLKLGNMLLNDRMQTKIADFGLATRVEYDGEKKMTVCGTPNYIAPEVLQKKGHSYEADIWALGCIMYAMLVGKPPFETSTLKETYMRITANKFFVPPHISRTARHLITKLLAPDPRNRPTLDKILSDEFFSSGHSPKSLPTSCCETPPKFPTSSSTSSSQVSIPSRPRSYAAPVPSSEAMQKMQSALAQFKGSRKSASQIITKAEKSSTPREAGMRQASSTPHGVRRSNSAELKNVPSGSAIKLYQMLTNCLEQMPQDANPCPVHVSKQQWVTKWVDYSNKYGFGFQLSDKSVGILFNDTTRMLLGNDGKTCQYNDLSNKVYTFTTDTAPEDYQKKVTLLLYFAQYMDEHLIHGGDMLTNRENVVPPSGIFMKKWFRTGKAIVMYLNNGTLQVNFFEDHTKVILIPDGQDYLVTYINSKRQAVTYRLLQFRHFGCHPDIQERLRYARRMLESIINIEGEAV